MILKLAMEYGLHPKRVASTNGGEYHSPCPRCGGNDRFIIWSAKNRYYCRQCEAKGDSIQFCRDFLGMTFQDACNKTGADSLHYYFRPRTFYRKFEPKNPATSSQKWQEKALAFVHTCHARLLNSPEMMDALKKERGLSEDSIRKFCIGWNDALLSERAEDFGLKSLNSSSNKIYLDRGFVIPFFSDKILTKVKIRRADWHQNGQLSKYYELKGSMPVSSLFDYFPQRPFLIVEAEFDAMLISQLAGNICCIVALGGASKKPDLMTHQLLLNSPLILFSLDFDEAGKKAFRFWRETYPNLYAWPVPKEKGPCDALKAGVDLKSWILAGIEHFQTIS